LDLCNGLMPVILSTAVRLPFIQPDHVRAVSNCFVAFVISFKASVQLASAKRANCALTTWRT
jgi:hypothetical protein